jgi:hypothetical protein
MLDTWRRILRHASPILCADLHLHAALTDGQTGKFPKSNAISDIWKDWIAIYFYLDACRIVIVGEGGCEAGGIFM